MSYNFLEDEEFTVTEATIESDNFDEDDPTVDRIVLKTNDLPENDQITIKPKKPLEKEKKVNGYPVEGDETVPITISEMPENIGKVIKAVNSGKWVNVKASVTEWIQADEPETEGDETYYFIRQPHIEDFKGLSSVTPEKKQDELFDEKAEDYAKDVEGL